MRDNQAWDRFSLLPASSFFAELQNIGEYYWQNPHPAMLSAYQNWRHNHKGFQPYSSYQPVRSSLPAHLSGKLKVNDLYEIPLKNVGKVPALSAYPLETTKRSIQV